MKAEHRRDVWGLTRKQKYALILLEWSEPGVVTTGATGSYDGETFIHWRTAFSLHERGLVRVHPYGEAGAEVRFA